MSTRILLVDDHQIVREGLRALLGAEPGMEVVGEAADGRAAVELAVALRPALVIMDISLPILNGIEATRQIRGSLPGVKVLALSMYSDRRFVTEALRAGASGYLLKDCAFEELAQAIKTVIGDRPYLSPGIAGVLLEDYLHRAAPAEGSAFSVLTERERQVLQLFAEGKGTREVAKLLSVSAKTVETHRRNLMEKLGLHSMAELTKYAVREGLTPLEP